MQKVLILFALVGLHGLSYSQVRIPQTVPAAAAPSASAASDDYLRRTHTIIRKAQEEFQNPDLVSDEDRIDAADRIARGVPLSPKDAVKPQVPRSATRLPSLGELVPSTLSQNRMDVAAHTKSGVILFVSDSMPELQLKQAMQIASEHRIPILFRGVKRGETIDKSMLRAQRLASTINPLPDVQIDPRPFTQFSVQTVPAIVVWESDRFVKVSGNLSLDYATKRFQDGRFGDAGTMGQTFEIIEPDFLEEIARRLNNIDFDAKKKAAVARFWDNYAFHSLPAVPESKAHYFDPTVFVDDEIRDPEGRLIAPAGVSFNPLDLVVFNKTIVAFDATDANQLAFAKTIADKEFASGRSAILVTTALDKSRAWDAMAEYGRALFPHQIFILDQLLAARFGIDSVPSVVRAEGRMFKIEQFALKDLERK